MRIGQTLGILFGFGVGLVPPSGCKGTGECDGVACDYTHITVHIVDANGEPATASEVTYTVTRYDDDGALDTAEDATESGSATCTARDADTGECPTWVIMDGFGQFTVSAVLSVADGGSGTPVSPDPDEPIDLAQPTNSKTKTCCGLVASDEVTLIVDPDADTGS